MCERSVPLKTDWVATTDVCCSLKFENIKIDEVVIGLMNIRTCANISFAKVTVEAVTQHIDRYGAFWVNN